MGLRAEGGMQLKGVEGVLLGEDKAGTFWDGVERRLG